LSNSIEAQLGQSAFKIEYHQLAIDFESDKSRGDIFDENFRNRLRRRDVLDRRDLAIRGGKIKMI